MTEFATSQDTQEAKKSLLSLKNLLFAAGLIFLLVLFFVFAWGLQTRESTQLQGGGAPDFSVTTFDGQTYTLSELRGKPVVINFWASWCVECYKEAALLEQAWQDFKDEDVIFLGIAYLDTDKDALEYMAKYGITYPSGHDIASKIAKSYRITGVPETFFIDKQGGIKHVQIGPIEGPQLYSLIEEMLAGGSS